MLRRDYLVVELKYDLLNRRIFESGSGIESYNVEHDTAITIRQGKYLNNIVEQDRRSAKRTTRGMLGFKSFRCARVILGGIEIMHMICKGQLRSNDGSMLSAALQFYSLAA
jgi:putative transposase